MGFKDMTVLYGQYDTNVIVEYTVCLDFKPDDPGSYKQGKATDNKQGNAETVFYDELHVITTLEVGVKDNLMQIKILQHKLDMQKYSQTTQPLKSSLGVTENEYREFLQAFGFTLNEQRKWLNDVILLEGIKFPYTIEEIKTEVKFNEGSMHVFMEVEKEAVDFFEEEFWDTTFKHKKGIEDIPEEDQDLEFWDYKENADKDYLAAEEAAHKAERKRAEAAKKKAGGKKLLRL